MQSKVVQIVNFDPIIRHACVDYIVMGVFTICDPTAFILPMPCLPYLSLQAAFALAPVLLAPTPDKF